MNDDESSLETESALTKLGFTDSIKDQIVSILIGCILLGEMRFGERVGMDLSYPERMDGRVLFNLLPVVFRN